MYLQQDDHPLRVLMISPQFNPIVGGYERAAERLSLALVDAGMRVVVITERRDLAWPGVECIDGYEVRRLRCWYRRHCHAITSMLAFSVFLLRHGRDFDVWHVHQYGFHAALAVAMGKMLRRPVVLKLPSSAITGIEKAMGTGFVGRVLRVLHQRVNACIAVSEETRQEAIAFGVPSERVHLVPDGLDGRHFYPPSLDERMATRCSLGINCDLLVLYVGRLSAEKNPLGLLRAWAAVDTSARKNALLALVGDGPEWPKVQAEAQTPNLRASVYLAGQRHDVPSWYRAADLYVISSHTEGLSISMIEALASGLPVISTRVSGSSILLQAPPSGFVVNVDNTSELAAAIEVLLKEKATRRELSNNARPLFDAHFSLNTFSNNIIKLYKSLLNSKRVEELH